MYHIPVGRLELDDEEGVVVGREADARCAREGDPELYSLVVLGVVLVNVLVRHENHLHRGETAREHGYHG